MDRRGTSRHGSARTKRADTEWRRRRDPPPSSTRKPRVGRGERWSTPTMQYATPVCRQGEEEEGDPPELQHAYYAHAGERGGHPDHAAHYPIV